MACFRNNMKVVWYSSQYFHKQLVFLKNSQRIVFKYGDVCLNIYKVNWDIADVIVPCLYGVSES